PSPKGCHQMMTPATSSNPASAPATPSQALRPLPGDGFARSCTGGAAGPAPGASGGGGGAGAAPPSGPAGAPAGPAPHRAERQPQFLGELGQGLFQLTDAAFEIRHAHE